MTERDDAIRAALFAHDGMERLIREDGMPREAVEPEPVGFLAALKGLGFTVAALVRTPETLPEEPAQLGCGCLVGVHENTMAAMREAHPEIVWPTDDGLAHYYWVGSHGVADGGNVRTPETLDALGETELDRCARRLGIEVLRGREKDAEIERLRRTPETLDAAGEYPVNEYPPFASPAPDPGAGPESYCHRCGGPNVSWSAPSPLWNAVMRGGDINGPWKWDEIICPTCFAVLAEEAGIASEWRLDARTVNVELATATPSGRVWDPAQDLWLAPSAEPPETER